MRMIATDDEFRRAAEKVLLRAEDVFQEIDTEGHLLHQWCLRTSPDLKNVGPESMEVLRQLNEKFLPEIVDEYSREGRRITMKNLPKWTWFSKGIVARKGQVIVIVKTRNPEYSKHFTKEPTQDHANTNPRENEGLPSANHQQNASTQTTKSIPMKQKPSTTIPLQKLEEQCYGVVMDSHHEHHPLEIRVGDILVVHDEEGVVLKSGVVGGIVTELKDM